MRWHQALEVLPKREKQVRWAQVGKKLTVQGEEQWGVPWVWFVHLYQHGVMLPWGWEPGGGKVTQEQPANRLQTVSGVHCSWELVETDPLTLWFPVPSGLCTQHYTSRDKSPPKAPFSFFSFIGEKLIFGSPSNPKQ